MQLVQAWREELSALLDRSWWLRKVMWLRRRVEVWSRGRSLWSQVTCA